MTHIADAAGHAESPTNPAGRQTRRAALATVLMGVSAVVAWQLTPTQRLSAVHGDFNLDTAVPKAFGDWQLDTTAVGGIVNPQQEELLKRLYSQILTRTYVNSQGQRVMLSIAYGNDQRDGLQLHYPEICYPAQGFRLASNRKVDLQLAGLVIPARRLETVLGEQRYEPVTYWTVIGETAVRGGTDKKIAEMRYGFRGVIPDGLLFRVSSIDRDTAAAYALQDQFSTELLTAVPVAVRGRIAGVDHIG
ncbi:exosortase-associated protein EpsI, B-type [Roseateles sp. BYS78W]|uniref:Exosortase-associated protein EpsI, B-type n=1 Tax=Pelomonas candidula TaxID=3299025 RepID=A0ABW7HC77_9BURK